jgi:adenosylcobinamide-GDP ribazoletransferase
VTGGRLVEQMRLATTVPALGWREPAVAPAGLTPPGPTPGAARFAVLATPLVGAVVAAIAAGVLLVARHAYVGPAVYIDVVRVEYLEAPILAAALAIVAVALLTRGRQLAGLASTVDELTSAPGHASGLGVVALAGGLLLQVLALGSSVLAHHGTQSLLFAVVSGRLAIVWSCTPGTPSRPGDDAGARFARTVPWLAALGWTFLICAGAAVYGRYDSEVGSPHGALRGVVAVLVALAASWLLRRCVVRRLGGISSASLGAIAEVAAVVSLLVTASGRP